MSIRLLLHAVLGLAIAVAVGCATSTIPSVSVAVRTVEDSVGLERKPGAALFRVTAVVRNDDTKSIHVFPCGPAAQREINGEWITVFAGPFCLGGEQFWDIAGGDSAVIPVTIFGYTDPHSGPSLDPRMTSGRYRLVFHVGVLNPSHPLAPPSTSVDVGSSPFIVRE